MYPSAGEYLGSVPFFLRVRTAMSWWYTHKREIEVLAFISGGVVIGLARIFFCPPEFPLQGKDGRVIAGLELIPSNWRRVLPTEVLCSKCTHPVVCDFKVRGRAGETQADQRLQGLKQNPRPAQSKLGHIRDVIPFFKKAHVGCKGGPQACLFLFGLGLGKKDHVCIQVAHKNRKRQ